jgi:type I restriction enzyme M protein
MLSMEGKSFRDEHSLETIIQQCHNIIWERQGYDPAQAFDELSKLLLLKIYDESRNPKNPQFSIMPKEGMVEVSQRIRGLCKLARDSPGFRDIFALNGDLQEAELQVDDLTIFEVAKRLSIFSLSSTTNRVLGPDIAGTVYETMITRIFRGKLGQFFTHRALVEFMVRFVGIQEEYIVYDPACGSGGFLIMCIKLLREHIPAGEKITLDALKKRLFSYSENKLLGTDINERAVRTAKINMLMHGVSPSCIYKINALKPEDDLKLQKRLKEGMFDRIFTNPPFAGYEKDPNILKKFTLGMNELFTPVAVTREILFIERIIRLLKDGGIAGIVVPQGILTNRSLRRVREYIKSKAKILAVVELPDWAFYPSGTRVRGSLLFLQKLDKVPKDYSVFIKKFNNIGYTSTGRVDNKNELQETIHQYSTRDSGYFVPISQLKDRIDARFYTKEARELIRIFQTEGKYPLVSLKELGTFDVKKYNPRKYPKRMIKLVEIGDVDPITLKITFKPIKGSESNYSSLKVLRAGDILISRRRPYRTAIVKVPEELTGAMAIPEFSVLRPHPEYNSDLILEILRSTFFTKLMMLYSTGELSNRVSERELKNLKIPIPENQHTTGQQLAKMRSEAKVLEDKLTKINETISSIINQVVCGNLT